MKRVFKTRYFTRWMRKTGLSDDALCAAVAEMAHGLVDADLGGGVFKKRVGAGKQLDDATNDGSLTEICNDHKI